MATTKSKRSYMRIIQRFNKKYGIKCEDVFPSCSNTCLVIETYNLKLKLIKEIIILINNFKTLEDTITLGQLNATIVSKYFDDLITLGEDLEERYNSIFDVDDDNLCWIESTSECQCSAVKLQYSYWRIELRKRIDSLRMPNAQWFKLGLDPRTLDIAQEIVDVVNRLNNTGTIIADKMISSFSDIIDTLLVGALCLNIAKMYINREDARLQMTTGVIVFALTYLHRKELGSWLNQISDFLVSPKAEFNLDPQYLSKLVMKGVYALVAKKVFTKSNDIYNCCEEFVNECFKRFRQTGTIVDIVDNVVEIFTFCANYLSQQFAGCDLINLEDKVKTDVDIYIDNLMNFEKMLITGDKAYNVNSFAELLTFFHINRNLMYRTKDSVQGKIIMEILKGQSIRLSRLLERFMMSNISKSGTRLVPLFLMLMGPTNIGKSWLTSILVKELISILPQSIRDFYGASMGSVISWMFPKSNDHHDGYNGQPFFIMDDWCQRKDTPQNPAPEVMAVIDFVNSEPFPMKMADLASKGTMFSSLIGIASTNITNFEHSVTSINCVDALKRRFHIPILVAIKPQFNKHTDKPYDPWESTLDQSKLPHDPVDNGTIVITDHYDIHILDLDRKDDQGRYVIAETVDVPTLIKYCKHKFKQLEQEYINRLKVLNSVSMGDSIEEIIYEHTTTDAKVLDAIRGKRSYNNIILELANNNPLLRKVGDKTIMCPYNVRKVVDNKYYEIPVSHLLSLYRMCMVRAPKAGSFTIEMPFEVLSYFGCLHNKFNIYTFYFEGIDYVFDKNVLDSIGNAFDTTMVNGLTRGNVEMKGYFLAANYVHIVDIDYELPLDIILPCAESFSTAFKSFFNSGPSVCLMNESAFYEWLDTIPSYDLQIQHEGMLYFGEYLQVMLVFYGLYVAANKLVDETELGSSICKYYFKYLCNVERYSKMILSLSSFIFAGDVSSAIRYIIVKGHDYVHWCKVVDDLSELIKTDDRKAYEQVRELRAVYYSLTGDKICDFPINCSDEVKEAFSNDGIFGYVNALSGFNPHFLKNYAKYLAFAGAAWGIYKILDYNYERSKVIAFCEAQTNKMKPQEMPVYCNDKVLSDVKKSVTYKNLFQVCVNNAEGNLVRVCFILFYKGCRFITNHHSIDQIKNYSMNSVLVLKSLQPNTPDIEVGRERFLNLTPIPNSELGTGIVDLMSFPLRPDITDKFIPGNFNFKNEFSASWISKDGIMIDVSRQVRTLNYELKTNSVVRSISVDGSHVYKCNDEPYLSPGGVFYRCDRTSGDCGYPIYIDDPSMRAARIFAIHAAGSAPGIDSYATFVNRNHILEADRIHDGAPLDRLCSFTNTYDLPVAEALLPPFQVESCYPNKAKQVQVSKITTSKLHESLDPTPFVKSDLSVSTKDIASRYSIKTKRTISKELISVSVKGMLDKVKRGAYNNIFVPEKFSFGRAITADGCIKLKSLTLTTSSGCPLIWSVKGIKGKKSIVGSWSPGDIGKCVMPMRTQIYDFIYDNDCYDSFLIRTKFGLSSNPSDDYYWDLSWVKNCKLVVDDIKAFISAVGRNEYIPPIYVDYQKDELLKPGKETRIFSAAPLWYTILVRMYLGSFMDWCCVNNIHNEMAIGMNPFSEEWDRLYRVLRQNSKACPSDFKKFDTDANPEIMSAIGHGIAFDLHNSYTSNDQYIIFFLLYGVCFSLHVMDKFSVVMWFLGMPSGNPLTALINCLTQLVLIRMCWCVCFGLQAILVFTLFVVLIVLGDDGLRTVSDAVYKGFVVSEKFSPEFVQKCMKDFGYTMTGIDKDAGCRYMSFGEVEFLKRKFVFSRTMGRVIAPLSRKSMLKMLYYTKNNDEDISYTNYEKYMWELSYHGKPEYTKVMQQLSKIADDRNCKFPIVIPYEVALKVNSARQYDSLDDTPILDYFFVEAESYVGGKPNIFYLHNMDTIEINEAQRQQNVTDKVPEQNITEFVSSGAIVSSEPPNKHQKPFASYVDGMIGSQVEDIKTFLARPVQVYRSLLAPAKNAEPFNISLPDGLTGYYSSGVLTSGQSMYYNKLAGFLGMRCDFNVKIIVNAQPFQQGLLMLRFVPFTGTMTYERDMWNADLIMKSQQQRVVVDIACDTEGNLYIPFCYPAPFFNLMQNNKLNVYNMGTVYLTGYSDFKTGSTSTSTDFEVSIYISCHNVELMGPVYPTAQSTSVVATKSVAGSSDKEKRPSGAPPKPVSHTGTILEAAGEFAGKLPLLSTFSEPLKWMGRFVDAPAAYFGFATPVLNNTQMSVQQLDRQYWNNCDQPRHAYVLGMTSDNAVVHSDECANTEFDEMSIQYIAQRWSYYKTANWTTSTAVDAAVFKTDINPSAFASFGNTIGATTNVTYPTPIYYVAQPFTYWRGDIKLRFRVVKTQFHSGRLILLFIPGNTASLVVPTSISTTNSQYCIREIIDIREGNVFEYTIPYVYPDMWNTFAQGGAVYLVVQNLLRATDQVANNIDIVVEVAAGDNFEVAVPGPLNMAPICPTAQSFCEIASGTIGGYQLSPDNESPTALCMGEKVTSIRQYLQRFHNMRNVYSPPNSYWSFYPWIKHGYSPNIGAGALQNNGIARPDAWSYFAHLYALFRGGVMLSIDNYGNTDTQVVAVNDPSNNALVDGTVRDYTSGGTSYSAGSGLNYICPPVSQVGAPFVKIPFYHQNPSTYLRGFYSPGVSTIDPDNRYTSHTRCFIRYKSSGVVNQPRIMRALADDASFQYFVACVPLTVSQA